MTLSPLGIANKLLDIAADKKASDINLLEITDITVLSDYFLICTANSTTHARTLCEEMELTMKEAGIPAHHTEGRDSNTWLLIDFGCAVAHIFLKETREFYHLDKLWSDAKLIAQTNWGNTGDTLQGL
jgi:ribosome-associated protein